MVEIYRSEQSSLSGVNNQSHTNTSFEGVESILKINTTDMNKYLVAKRAMREAHKEERELRKQKKTEIREAGIKKLEEERKANQVQNFAQNLLAEIGSKETLYGSDNDEKKGKIKDTVAQVVDLKDEYDNELETNEQLMIDKKTVDVIIKGLRERLVGCRDLLSIYGECSRIVEKRTLAVNLKHSDVVKSLYLQNQEHLDRIEKLEGEVGFVNYTVEELQGMQHELDRQIDSLEQRIKKEITKLVASNKDSLFRLDYNVAYHQYKMSPEKYSEKKDLLKQKYFFSLREYILNNLIKKNQDLNTSGDDVWNSSGIKKKTTNESTDSTDKVIIMGDCTTTTNSTDDDNLTTTDKLVIDFLSKELEKIEQSK